jgi:hypothetical protein
MIKKIEKDKINLSTMASGHLYLLLSEEVDWHEFTEFANYVVKLIGAKVKAKDESVVIITWKLVVDNQIISLVYDDYPLAVSLESDSKEGDKKILEIFEILKN